MAEIPVRIGLQQRVLPSYRVPFFDTLADVCPQGLSVFAGNPRAGEALANGAVLLKAQYFHAHNIHTFKGIFYACWQVNIKKWLDEWRPRVLIMEANPRYPYSYTAIRWMRENGGRVIGWGLGSPKPLGSFSRLRLLWRKSYINRFDALITYSQAGTHEYTELGFREDHIFKAPNAVAPKPTQPMVKRPSTYKAGKPSVLFVGRLQARKNVDRLIRACAQIPPEQQPFLSIVGDGPMRPRLENLAREIYPSTTFFGAQHGSELDLLFQNADLFVLPGTGGLAVQQAMSFGLPVIVGVADGTQSDLVREKNGWMLADGSIDVLSTTIQEALSDIRRLRKMGAASYQIVSREVNLERMVEAFVQAVNFVLEE